MSYKRKKDSDIEDFSKSNEIHKIARQRIKTDNNEFSLDLKSILICKLIGINRDYALKPLLKYKKRLNALTSTDEELIERIKIYNLGVDHNLFPLYRDKSKWIEFLYKRDDDISINYKGFAILELGEIVKESGELIGTLVEGKMKVHINDNKPIPRSHLILFAAGYKRIDKTYTANHINRKEPLNDSISNLNWSNKKEQNLNRRESSSIKSIGFSFKVINIENN